MEIFLLSYAASSRAFFPQKDKDIHLICDSGVRIVLWKHLFDIVTSVLNIGYRRYIGRQNYVPDTTYQVINCDMILNIDISIINTYKTLLSKKIIIIQISNYIGRYIRYFMSDISGYLRHVAIYRPISVQNDIR